MTFMLGIAIYDGTPTQLKSRKSIYIVLFLLDTIIFQNKRKPLRLMFANICTCNCNIPTTPHSFQASKSEMPS